jgi:hypothetical protein
VYPVRGESILADFLYLKASIFVKKPSNVFTSQPTL